MLLENLPSFAQPHHLASVPRTWALDKFAVFNTVWQQTLDELRPLLRHYAVRPLAVNQSTAALVPIQMATKPLPGMEAEEAKSLQAMGDLEPAEVEVRERAVGQGGAGRKRYSVQN